MAFASVGSIGTGAITASATSAAITTSATAEAGNLVLLLIGAVPIGGGADGASSEIISVVDSSGGNVWYRIEQRNQNSQICSIWWSVLKKTISSGATITASFTAREAVAMSTWEFTMGAGNIVTAADIQRDAEESSGVASLAISGLANAEYLFVRGIATLDDATTALTNTASYTNIPAVVADGPAFTNSGIRGEFRILTGTGDTSAPTLFSDDHASLYIAFSESAQSFIPFSVML